MESECSLLYAQEMATGPYFGPAESSQHLHNMFV